MPRTPKKPATSAPTPVETFSRTFEQIEMLTVTTLEQLKIISDPQRLEIMEAVVTEAHTVKQIADMLGKPATKLYYHMAALEGAGFVTVVETRIKSGIVEKYYRTTAQQIKVDPRLLQSSVGPNQTALDSMLATIFDATVEEIRRGVAEGLIQWSGAEAAARTTPKQGGARAPRNVVLTKTLFSLRDEDIPKFLE